MLGDLTGRTALVTGAASGIGRGIAMMLAAQNASVAVTDLDQEGAERVAGQITGVKTLALRLDVTDQASIDQAVQGVISEWGALDILVANVGVSLASKRVDGKDTDEDWHTTFAINVKGVADCCNAVIPHMQQRSYGKIITIGSIAGHSARRRADVYAASKAAVLRYTKGLADSLALHNINVNAICPAGVWTEAQRLNALARQQRDPSLADKSLEQIFLDYYETAIPLGRPQTPEDIGKMAAFLASEDARNVTGQCIHVDGGAVLRD